jgi:hypothetical protein
VVGAWLEPMAQGKRAQYVRKSAFIENVYRWDKRKGRL